MEKEFNVIERFVQTAYLLNIINLNANKGALSLDNGFTSINFMELGLPEEILEQLGTSPSLEMLKTFSKEIEQLSNAYMGLIYGTMICELSDEDKAALKELIDVRAAQYVSLANRYENICLSLNGQLQGLLKGRSKLYVGDTKEKIKDLGRAITLNSNKAYEYTTYSSIYSNISSYIRGMLGKKYGLK